ncbi:MAG TPA: class I SAM-dependent methyltransferase [Candidatus Cryosericum sp.]|nr:class I SAM-dependent methyltransferase [Candidatus Cryosericum sp.]
MGFYARHVLPRLIEATMRKEDTARLRAAWMPRASGEVLELGIGSGLNLPFYSGEVRKVYGVDPSLELQRLARQRATGGRVEVQFLAQSAEEPLPLGSGSIDTAVVTWSLCSIPDAPKALGHVKRVLKPSGLLIFLEHGRSPDPGVVAWQDRITPLFKRIGGGCHLNRKIDDLIATAGFRIGEMTTGYQPGPRMLTYTYQGVARPL